MYVIYYFLAIKYGGNIANMGGARIEKILIKKYINEMIEIKF